MVSIIVAVAKNGVIGCANRLIWHLSEDLKRFKALTSGHPVIMGRKTYESIGRPLPNRTNVVVSRNADLRIEGVTVVGSLDEAIAVASKAEGGREEVFIIGGDQIYAQTMERALADRIYYTQVDQEPEGDAFFVPIDPAQWRTEKVEQRDGFRFIDYVRI